MSRFVQLGYGRTEYFTWEDTVTDPSRIALSFYSGLFSYTGWNYLNFIIEEMKVREKKEFSHKTPSQNPVRDLPRAIAISCVIVLLIYVLTIVSFHTTLSTAEVTFPFLFCPSQNIQPRNCPAKATTHAESSNWIEASPCQARLPFVPFDTLL